MRAVSKVRFVPVISVVDSDAPSARKVIRSVTHLVPACHDGSGCQTRLPRVSFRLRAAHALLPIRREPENIQCPAVFIQWKMTGGSPRLTAERPTSRRLTVGSNHHKI